jgi:hypothetical protein
MWDIACNRLAPMRVVPFSYFCTCWKVKPRLSPRLPAVLALEIPLPGRSAASRSRPAGANPTDQRGQSAMGCAAHPSLMNDSTSLISGASLSSKRTMRLKSSKMRAYSLRGCCKLCSRMRISSASF